MKNHPYLWRAAAPVHPGDIDHDFTASVNRRQARHRLAQFCWRVAKAVPYVAAGWFAHGFWY